jgi:thioredoxin 1
MKTHELVLTDADFDTQASEGVVLIDFWAPRCGPCRQQLPIIDKVATAMAGQAKVGKCNVDEQPKTSERFRIRQIPTLVILKDKREVERFVGLQPETALMAAIKKHMGEDARGESPGR